MDVEHPAVDMGVAIQIWPVVRDPERWPPLHVLDLVQLGHFIRMVAPSQDAPS